MERFELRRFDVIATLAVQQHPDRRAIEMLVNLHVRDRDSGEPNQVMCRELVSEDAWNHMRENLRASIVWEACCKALLHELAECFYVDGVRVRDPHKDEEKR